MGRCGVPMIGASEAWPMGRCGVPMIGAEWLPAAG